MDEQQQEPGMPGRMMGPGMKLWLLFSLNILFMFIVYSLANSHSLSWLTEGTETGWPAWLIRLGKAWTSALFYGLPVLLLSQFFPADGLEIKKQSRRPLFIFLLLAVAIILVETPGDDWLYSIGRSFVSPQDLKDLSESMKSYDGVLDMSTFVDVISNLVVFGLVAAVCEELFYRAGVQRLIHNWSKNPHVAVLITAFVFTIMHGTYDSFMPLMLQGIFFGYLFFWGGSLWLSIAAHFTNNALFLLFYYLNTHYKAVAQFEFPDWTGPVSIGAAFTLLLLVKRMKEKKDGEMSSTISS